MNKDYKTFEELKEELGDKFEEFMYKANIELLDKVNQLEQANKSLRGNIKAIAKTSNNRHLEIKRLLKKLDKLEFKNAILEAHPYCPYDKDCGKLYDCTTEEYLSMCDANVDLMAKINQLETNWNELKEYIRKTKIKEFEKTFGKRYGKTFRQAEIIVCNMLIEKMQELEGGSNE